MQVQWYGVNRFNNETQPRWHVGMMEKVGNNVVTNKKPALGVNGGFVKLNVTVKIFKFVAFMKVNLRIHFHERVNVN